MLSRLVAGAEESNNLLVSVSSQDSNLTRDIINSFLSSPKQSLKSVLIRTGPTSVLSDLPISEELDLSDLQGWRRDGVPLKFPEVVYNAVDLGTQNIVIDNLTDLLLFFKHATVTQFIRKLRQSCGRKNKIFFILHRDCIAAEVLEDITKFLTTTINLSDIKGQKVCKIQHTKPGGKLVSSAEVIRLDREGKIKTTEYREETVSVVEDSDADSVLSSLTTFSLGTKETEKEVKDRLVLPFHKDSQSEAGQVKISGDSQSGSKIYYEPDSGDDWDDEDPDDDLDF